MVEARRSSDFLLKLRNFTRTPLISDQCLCADNSYLLLLSIDVPRGQLWNSTMKQQQVCGKVSNPVPKFMTALAILDCIQCAIVKLLLSHETSVRELLLLS